MKDIAIQLVDQLLADAADGVNRERVNNLAERLMLQAQHKLTIELQQLIRDKETSMPPPDSPIITRNISPAGLEMAKRTYVPFTIIAKCPQCGQTMTRNLSTDCMLSPAIGEAYEVALYHEADNGDDHELLVNVILDVTLKVVP